MKKGIVKKASDRIRLRRRFFNALRAINAPKVVPGYDMLFIANASVVTIDPGEFMGSVAAAVRSIAR